MFSTDVQKNIVSISCSRSLFIKASLNSNSNTKDENGRSVFYQSVVWGKYNMANELLDNGADINAYNDSKYPETALHYCTMKDIPKEEELTERPDSLEYPQNFPKYRFYGNNIKRMIDVANSWEESEKKEALVLTIANHMKKCFLNWNKDTVEDDVIFNHLFELSDGSLNLKESNEKLLDTMTILKNKKTYSNKKTHKPHKNNKGRTWKKY